MYISDTKIEEIIYREGLRIAPIGKRVLAYLIDEILVALLSFLVFMITIKTSSFYNTNYLDLLILILFIWLVVRGCYYFIFGLLCGSSVGKILTRIRIIMVDTLDRPDFFSSLIRVFAKELGTFFLFSTYFFVFDNVFIRTLHDRIARTIVVT